MSDTPTSILTDTPLSFPEIPSDGLELGNLASSFASAMLGPFEVHDVIGRGGMGIVFSGVHVGQQIPVAIKVITRQGAEEPHLRQVMHNEVRAVAGLDHPGIVRVFDYGEISDAAEVITEGALRAGSPYFVMEMMAHSSLLEISGRVSWRQAKTILLDLLDALAHSHARDVIHRDIKPGNILLDDWGGRVVPRLADFGLAFATRQPTDVSRSIGTPQYMAPEQIETPWRKHGPWSDLYSLGCLAFELLSGQKLFDGRTVLEIFRMHLDGVRKPLRSMVRVPDGFDAWLHRMTERNAQDRFQSAAEAATELAVLDDDAVPDLRPPDCTPHDFALVTPVLGNMLAGEPASTFEWPKRFPISMRLVGAGLGLFGLRQIPLVGRRLELESLWSAFQTVAASNARVVVLHGPHGIGKTKLVDTFAQRLAEIGAATPMRATHTESGSPDDGAPMMIARWLRAAGATRAEAGEIVCETITADSAARYAWESVLALIEPTLTGSGGDVKYAFEFGSKVQRHEVVTRQVRHAADRTPVVMLVDDAHYSEDSLELVHHLLREANSDESEPMPALVLLTVCDEELAARPGAKELLDKLHEMTGVQRLDLAPLDDVTHLSLVQDLSLLSGDLAIGVATRTHGNPGFAVKLIDDWITNGRFEVGETGFVLSRDADLLDDVPTSERELWRGMLERVFASHSDHEKMSLEIAAALGVTVWNGEWISVCQSEGVEPCWPAVGGLVDRRLATMTAMSWKFEHPVAGEFLRESAEQAGRWKRWKAACAGYLGAQTSDDTPEKLQRIGEYFLGAGQFEDALEPLRQSAHAKLYRGDYREADQLTTGMITALHGALEVDERELARAHLFRARVYMGMGRSDEALRWARKARDAAIRHDWPALIAPATGFAALAKRWLGHADADEWLDRTLELLDGAEATEQVDGLLVVLGYLLTSLGRFDDASRVLELGYEHARRSGVARALASCAYQRCRTAIYMREFDRARTFGEEASQCYTRIGHVPALSATTALLAEVCRLQSDLDQAQALYRESIELARSVGHESFVSMASLGVVLVAQGRFDEAEELFLDAANEAAAAGRRRTEIVCKAGLLVCAVEQAHWSSASRLVPAIEEFTADTAETEIDLAELLERAGDGYLAACRLDDARGVWAMAHKQWQTLGAEDLANAVLAKLKPHEAA